MANEISILPNGERLHAELGASSAHQWTVCTAAINEQRGKERPSSEFSRWGTVNHLLASTALQEGKEPDFYRHWYANIKEGVNHREALHAPFMTPPFRATYSMQIDQEQIDCATYYTNFVRNMVDLTGAQLLVEIRVPVSHITGEEGAKGTADAVLLNFNDRELVVIDLKGGEGIKVEANYSDRTVIDMSTGEIVGQPNLQLSMYADGARVTFDPKGEYFDTIRMMIVQPRLNHVSEYVLPVGALKSTIDFIAIRAIDTRFNPVYAPSIDTCRFCAAKGLCAAQLKYVSRELLDDDFLDENDEPPVIEKKKKGEKKSVPTSRQIPEQIQELQRLYSLIPFFNATLDAIAERMHEYLVRHKMTDQYKLVRGNKGHRQFVDEDAVALAIIDDETITEGEAYTRTFISPAQLQDLLKKKKRPDIYEQLAASGQVIQGEGKDVIAPMSDPRPAIEDLEDEFTDDQSSDSLAGSLEDLWAD